MNKRTVVELEQLRDRLREAEETLAAIRNGEVDSLVVSGPHGDHVFSLEVLYTPYSLDGGWADSDEPSRWLDLYAGLVQPGWRDSIRAWRAMTPVAYEEQFFLPRGHATSFAGGPVAALLSRQRELTRYETPVKGLYLTGASTHPGGGIMGASGRNAARIVLKDLSRRRI